MFHTVEKYKTPAQILLGLIGLTFIGFGVSTAAPSGSDYIVQVGDQKVSEHDLNNAVQAAQAANSNQSRDAVFQSLLQRAYLTQGAKVMGIAVSQEQIKQIIVDDPSFHDANGNFSQTVFAQYLNQRHQNEDQFVEEIREQFALQNLLNLVQNGTIVSDVQADQIVRLTQATRSIRSATFRPETFAAQVKVDDAALQRYYDAHKNNYLIPQAAKIEYVALNAQDFAAQQTVSAEEVKKAFDEESKAKAQQQIVFEKEKSRIENELKLKKSAAKFNEAKEKLAEIAFNSPDSLEQAAKELNLKIEASDEWLTQAGGEAAGMPADLIKAVFSDDVLNKKHNSEPVTVSPDTVWVVRAKEVRTEKTAPFVEVKDSVRDAYVRSEAVKLAEQKAQAVLADMKAGKTADVQWSPLEELNAQQARQSMPPEAYNQLVKARPNGSKPGYVLLEGLPAPVVVEVQKITPPANLKDLLPSAKQALMQQQSGNVFDQLLQYLNKQIEQKQGAQKVNAVE